MLGSKVICDANGHRSKYDLTYVEQLANDKSNPFQAKVFGQVLAEINKIKPAVVNFNDKFTVYFISASTKTEYEMTGKVVQLRGISYLSQETYLKS